MIADITDFGTYSTDIHSNIASLDLVSGTNTGDQTSIVGITGTKAQFDLAVTDGNFLYVGDAPTAHTHVIADITDANDANWDLAFGWGDHALAGYITSETDNQTLTWTDGTNNLAISGGNSVTITGFADTSHSHVASDITDFDTEVSNNTSVAANTAKTSFPGFTSLIADYGFTDNSGNWNTAYNDKINSASFNVGDGVLTLTQQDATTITVDLDGRYVENVAYGSVGRVPYSSGSSFSYSNGLNWNNGTNTLELGGILVNDITPTFPNMLVDGDASDNLVAIDPTTGVLKEITLATLPYADTSHTHVTADITNLSSYTGLDTRYYTETEMNASLALKANLASPNFSGTPTISGVTIPTISSSNTLTNKTIAFGSNTLTNVMSTNTAQSVTAGIKKTFQSNATNAGFRLAGVTANPSTLSNGDIWFRSTEGQLYYRENATTRTLATTSKAQTLSLKTIALGSNTITGTKSQFNTALTDGDFAFLSDIPVLTDYVLKAGDTMTGDLTFNSNVGVLLSNDTDIYSDGSHTIINLLTNGNLYMRDAGVDRFVFDIDTGAVTATGGTNNSFYAVNPNNASASVSLSWLSDIPRLRVGGSGAGAFNGFEIQDAGDDVIFKVDGGGTQTQERIRITDETDVSLTSTLHGFQIGASNTLNLAMDSNEIQVRNNGAAGILFIQADGGSVNIGNAVTTSLTVSGQITTSGNEVQIEGGSPRIDFVENSATTNFNIIADASNLDIRRNGTNDTQLRFNSNGFSQFYDRLTISGDAVPLITQGLGSATTAQNYFLARDSVGANMWYIGISSASNNNMLINNYYGGNYIALGQSGGESGLTYYTGTNTRTVYHSGNLNVPELGQLAFQTTGWATGNIGKWTKIATSSTTAFVGNSIVFTVTGSGHTDTSGEAYTQTIHLHVKQQATAGNNPYLSAKTYYKSGKGFDIGYVITNNNPFPSTVDFYIQGLVNYTSWFGYITSSDLGIGTSWTFHNSQSLLTTVSGLVETPAIQELTSEGGGVNITNDSGTTGLVLKGTSSGTYTMVQYWQYQQTGKTVVFQMILSSLNGTAPIGTLQLDISGTSMPASNYASGFSFLVRTANFPVNFYTLHLVASGNTAWQFEYQSNLDGSNTTGVTNADFNGTQSMRISGSYLTDG